MYTNTLLRIVGLACLFVSIGAAAQNFVDNPYFDTDLSSWQIFPSLDVGAKVVWTRSMDHSDAFSSGVGSLQITAPVNESFAQQCVSVENDDLYIVSTWVFSQCAGASLYLFWADNDCAYDAKYEPISARSSKVNQWEQLTTIGVVPDDRRKALVTLINPGDCAKDPNVYFDDVNFVFDWIWKDGFESEFVSP